MDRIHLDLDDPWPAADGVRCVDTEIGDDLVHLIGIHQDGGKSGRCRAADLDFRGQCGAQQPHSFGDHGLELQDLSVLIVPAAECQDLADERGGALARFLHVEH